MLPKRFYEKMKDMLGDRFELFLESYNSVPYRALRVNTLKANAELVTSKLPFLTKKTPFCDDSYYIEDGVRLGNHPLHHAGAFYIQEPSASYAVSAIGISAGDRVLDLCAAPGGKSTQAAAALNNTGFILSNEYVQSRVRPLASNIERMGIANSVVTSMRPDELCPMFRDFFDVVIVDAPCSGEGMFRKESAAVENWSEENVIACQHRQGKILDSAALSVAPGGKILYSTCTYSPEENEMTVAAFLKAHTDFHLIKPAVIAGEPAFAKYAPDTENIEYAKRIFNFHGGEGHFVALIERDGEHMHHGIDRGKAAAVNRQSDALKVFSEFFGDTFFDDVPENVAVVNDRVYIIPKCDLPQSLKSVTKGIFAGSVKGSRFVPEHALFNTSAFSARRKIDLDCDDELALKFFHGEEIPCEENLKGYTAVLINGIPAGFGKASSKVLKNHYPKGLRTL